MTISKVKEIRIKENEKYSNPIPIGADAVNIDTINGSNLAIDLDNIDKKLNDKDIQISNLQKQIDGLSSGVIYWAEINN